MSGLDIYFKTAFTVDNVIFGFDDGNLKVLLIKRGEEPFNNQWALPGYFVHADEDLAAAAKRILAELTGLTSVYLEQVQTFGAVGRHPEGRVITVAYYSLVKISDYKLIPASIARKAKWHSLAKVKDMPFDHNEILKACCQRLKKQVRVRPIGFELLPPQFTLTQLQYLYEAILETELDKRNFRKKILSMELLIDLDLYQEGVAHRPAKLYKFDQHKYEEFVANGFVFELSEKKKKGVKLKA